MAPFRNLPTSRSLRLDGGPYEMPSPESSGGITGSDTPEPWLYAFFMVILQVSFSPAKKTPWRSKSHVNVMPIVNNFTLSVSGSPFCLQRTNGRDNEKNTGSHGVSLCSSTPSFIHSRRSRTIHVDAQDAARRCSRTPSSLP